MGWDVGGAHLKAALLGRNGELLFVTQEPCPLWRGIEHLSQALQRVIQAAPSEPPCQHVVTMTGELADNFENRQSGVMALSGAMGYLLGPDTVRVFAGEAGFVPVADLVPEVSLKVASANWLASALWAGLRLTEALLVDVGSTTTDLVAICDNQPAYRGYTDSERMAFDELLYSGIIRTPVMALVRRAPLAGAWSKPMAEHFATMADVYRLTGELEEHSDQMPAADQGEKSIPGSQQRLARQFGRDAASLPANRWRQLADNLREQQLMALHGAMDIQFSRGLLGESAPLVGAGVGRFLVREMAQRLRRHYVDFSELFPVSAGANRQAIAACAPAAALAFLARQETPAQ